MPPLATPPRRPSTPGQPKVTALSQRLSSSPAALARQKSAAKIGALLEQGDVVVTNSGTSRLFGTPEMNEADEIKNGPSVQSATPVHSKNLSHLKERRRLLSRSMTRDSDIVRRMKEIERSNVEKFSIDTIASTKGISQSMLLEWLDKELDDEKACLQLPLALLLVVVFAAMSVSMLGNQYVQDVQGSIQTFLRENANFGFDEGPSTSAMGHKNLDDVHSIADVYSWLRLGFVPAVLSDSYSFSEHHPDSGASLNGGGAAVALPSQVTHPSYERSNPLPSDFLNWNHIAGSVRLTQALTSEHPLGWGSSGSSCSNVPKEFRAAMSGDDNENSANNHLTPCYGQGGSFPNLNQQLTLSRPLEHGKNTVYLPTSAATGFTSTAALQRQLADLEKQIWIRENVRQVQVSFFSLNREFGLWTMTTVSFTFRRGGAVLKDIYTQSTWLNFPGGPGAGDGGQSIDSSNNYILAVMGLWLAINAYIFLGECYEVLKTVNETKSFKRFAMVYFGVWNCVDWLTVFSCGSLIGFFIYEKSFHEELKSEFSTLIGRAPTTASGGTTISAAQVQANDERLYSLTLEIMRHHEELVFCSYIYVLVSLVRLFKGFSAQPRLGVVTSTMVHAAVEILHFLVVFSSVFFAYALAGVIVFGRHLEEFSTLDASITTCWRMVFGDFDYERTARIAPWEALVFFFSFTLLVVLIMLNMLLAIVLDTYMD